jgi:RNA polymerase sigma factor (sigma-70 family)
MLVDAVDHTESRQLDTALATERPRLVAFCAHLTGSWDAAEDLAQETLLEAWRSLDRLRDSDGLAPWLTAIARNVCLRWRRSKGREATHLIRAVDREETTGNWLGALVADDTDPGAAIEREELGSLLDLALAALPAETHAALVGSYVDETPQAELAARLGLSEGALRTRLHRGRRALRQALATTLRDDALALGISVDPQSGWQTTRIWCPFCGQRRLEYWLEKDTGSYTFRCPGPCASEISMLGSSVGSPLTAQFSSPKALLTRHCLTLGEHYRSALAAGRSACLRCGREIAAGQWLPGHEPPIPTLLYGVHLNCLSCQAMDSGSPWHLSLDTPEAQRFWRKHPRMRALPTREMEEDGRPALVIGYESVAGHDRLEIVAARATYETLRVFGEVAR